MKKKIIIVAATAVVVIGAAVAVIVSNPFAGSEAPKPTPVVQETQTPEPSAEPTVEPSTSPFDGRYNEFFTFPNGSTVATAGDLTVDCGAERGPVENSTLEGYSVDYKDEAKTIPVSIQCSWSASTEDLTNAGFEGLD